MVEEGRNPNPGPGDAWDGATWVEVGSDGRWHPSAGQRARAAIVLSLFLGALLALAGFASVDDGDGSQVSTPASSTSTTQAPATTTTTEPEPGPESVDGVAPPAPCRTDDRDGAPLREPASVDVLVLNTTATPGHAGAKTELYDAAGYTTISPRDGVRGSDTSITFQPGFCAEAVAAAAVLDIGDVEVGPVDPSVRGYDPAAALIVTLGEDTV